MKRFAFVLLLVFSASLLAQSGIYRRIDTSTLVGEMRSLHSLSEFPYTPYKTVQFSSYDHRSTLPGGPDWFSNSDGFGGEPIPNFEKVLQEPDAKGVGEYLICDVTGPGAIVRTWTAAIKGTVRLYLDGARTPLYDGPAEDFFLCTYKPFLKDAGLSEDLFDGTFTQRCAGYYPISFAKRCTVIWRGNLKEIHFYHLEVREYEKGAPVETFSPKDLIEYRQTIEQTAHVLHNPDGENYVDSPSPINIVIQPGENKEARFQDFSDSGGGCVERLRLKVQADNLQKALRQTVLQIYFDEYPWGQVQAPVGDFFGAAPGINPYVSLPFSVKPDGEMTCRFVMPFRKTVRIMLENKGDRPVLVSGDVLSRARRWNANSSMHFYARWRVDHDLLASNDTVMDLPFLLANGKGVYVGTVSYLLNPNSVPTSYGNWWGEGDEKIFVDNDFRPSFFGTGSEDYYNYAWSSGDIFAFPYCGQPRNDGPANRGFVTNFRWHILDPIPFQNRISFYMELFSHENTPGFSYARMSYYYAMPGMTDDHIPISVADVRELKLPEDWQPVSKDGAVNSTFLPLEELIEPNEEIHFVQDNLWQGSRLPVWTPKEKGEILRVKLPVQEKGEYILHLASALTSRSGQVSVKLDGKPLEFDHAKPAIDLFVPYRTLLRPFSTGNMPLDAGDHVLELQSEGKSDASQGNEIGIDFVWLQKK